MTGKEALELLVTHDWDKDYFKDEIAIMRKDLEAAEILKKYIRLDFDVRSNLNPLGFSGIDLLDLPRSELRKIIKWLTEEEE